MLGSERILTGQEQRLKVLNRLLWMNRLTNLESVVHRRVSLTKKSFRSLILTKSGPEAKLRCPAKILLNSDTGAYSLIEQHICSQARDLKNAKEEAMKEIVARFKPS